MTRLRVLTWNIRHCLTNDGTIDVDRFIAELPGFNADVILLQEVDRVASRSGNVDQYLCFKEALGYDWHGAWTKRCSMGWTGAYGIATFSRYEIYEVHHHLLSNIHKERCYAQEAIIEVDGRAVSVFNLHMPYENHTGALHTDTAWATLNELEFPPTCIVGGDLNAFEESPEAQVILKECVDVGTRSTSEWGRIDYCVGRGGAIPESQEVFHSDLSDHYPFVTNFLLKTFTK